MTTSSQPPEPLRTSAPPGDSDRIRALLLRAEQVKWLYAAAQPGFAATIASAVTLVAVEWEVIPHGSLLAWLAYMLAMTAGRFALVWAFQQAAPGWQEALRWEKLFLIGDALAGLGWGSTTFFMFPDSSIPHQFFLVLVLGGMTAGAVPLLSARLEVFLCFMLPTVLPITVRFASLGGPIATAIAGMAAIFSLVMVFISLRMSETIAHSLGHKLENIDLIDRLASQITRREQTELALKASEERYRLLVDQATDIIYRADPTGHFTFINPAITAVTQYSQAEVLGRRFSEFIRPDHRRATEHFYRRQHYRKIPTTYFEFPLVTKDGREIWFGQNVQLLIENGQVVWFQAVMRDLTERRQAEERLRQANADLITANQDLESFSYSVSHDLLAPLRHLDGFANLLKEYAASILDERGRRYLDNISEAAKQMGRLTDNLLAFSRMGRTELHKSWVSLDQLIKETLHELRHDYEGRHITWTIGALPEVKGDEVLLRQVFINLIANAIKYTRPHERAHIEIGLAPGPADNSEVTIFIRDNGVGFDMDYAHKLFGVFQRLHHADEFEGTGIGLANVRRITQRHGGRVWAEGAVGKGATFYVSLPKLDGAKPSP